MRHVVAVTLFVGIGLLGTGCQERSSELRTWRATEHDQADVTKQALVQPPEGAAPARDSDKSEDADGLAASPHAKDVAMPNSAMHTWAQRCMGCHGQIGGGDGPQGAGLNVPDLSLPAWQARATDEQIAKVIRQGEGKMPGFPLEPPAVAELVTLIRRMSAGAPSEDSAVIATPEPPKNIP